MRVFRVSVMLLFSGALVPVCIGQTGTTATPLRVLEEKPISLHLDSPAWRTVPGDGEFYVQNGTGKYLSLNLSGEAKVAFDLASVPGTAEMDPKQFFVTDLASDPRGGVIAPFIWQKEPEKPQLGKTGILHFDGHGAYSGTTWLQTVFTPTHIAEFSSSGNYLVTGFSDQGTVELSLFDFRGTLLVAHVLPTKSSGASSHSQEEKESGASDEAIHEAGLTQIAGGDDDAVYVFNPMRGRSVIRVQPSGQFSEIKLPAPVLKEGESTMPIGLFVSHGNLYTYEAILNPGEKMEEYAGELTHFELSVYDRYNGTLNATFRDDGQIGGVPVSLGPREFYFLKAKELPAGALSFSLLRAGQ